MKKYFVTSVILALFGAVSVTAQTSSITDDPTGKTVTVESTALYEHGYNAEAVKSGAIDAREVVDSVMVTSVMNYFVMPDKYFNTAYFKQDDYGKTNLTHSLFDWKMYNGNLTAIASETPIANPSIAYQSDNHTKTSPWIKVTWGATAGKFTLAMKETPQGVLGACEGLPALIPVVVINKPSIKFDKDFGDEDALFLTDCVDPDDETNGWKGLTDRIINFPVNVTTESGNVRVDYDLVFTPLGGGSPITFSNVTDKWVSVSQTGGKSELPLKIDIAALKTAGLPADAPAFGSYSIEITRITDHVGRKCDVDGIVDDGGGKINESMFTYIILPRPTPGRTYHVPNFFDAIP